MDDEGKGTGEKDAGNGTDMGELMARLASIRLQVEADSPKTGLSSRLVALVSLLAALALLPLVFAGPCS